jgi:hypothetical protein
VGIFPLSSSRPVAEAELEEEFDCDGFEDDEVEDFRGDSPPNAASATESRNLSNLFTQSILISANYNHQTMQWVREYQCSKWRCVSVKKKF